MPRCRIPEEDYRQYKDFVCHPVPGDQAVSLEAAKRPVDLALEA